MPTHHHPHTITVRQTPILLILKLTIVSLLFDLSFLFVAFISDSIESFNNGVAWNIIAYDTLSYILLMVIQMGVALLLMTMWYRETFSAQEGFLVHRKGLILINEKRHKIATAESVTYSQTLFGKLFGYGTITLKYPNQKELYRLTGIPEPEFFVHLLEEDKNQKN
jgi:hypothetical protein